MVHDIFHAMSEHKAAGFFWVTHLSTETYSKLLDILAILNSDVHYYSNPVIEGSSMQFFNFFSSSPIRGVFMKSKF